MSASSTLCCEPCKYRGKTSSSVKYCKSCQEKLCKECVDFHKSFKMTRGHLLVNTKDQQSLKLCLDIENLRNCKQHSNKPTEFYCWNHDTLMCSICLLKSEQHKNCSNKIVEIESVGQSLKLDCKFTDMIKGEFRNIISWTRRVANEMKEVKEVSKKSAETFKCEIELLRSKLLEMFDRQTQSIVQKATEINTDIADKYAETIEKLENEITRAEVNENIFQTVLESGTPVDVFCCMMPILEQIEEFKIETENFSENDEKQEFVMVKSELLKQLEENDKPLVHYHVKETKFKLHASTQTESIKDCFKNQIIAFCATEGQNLRNESDQETCVEGNDKTDKIPEDGSKKYSIVKGGSNRNTQNTNPKNEQTENRPISDTPGNSSDDVDDDKWVHVTNVKKQTKYRQENVKQYELEINHGCSFSVLTSDSKVSWFGGIACLSNDRLVLSDFNNSRLILLDADNQILTTKTLEYEPGHINLLSATSLAVCLLKTNQILLTDIKKNTIKENKYVQTKFHPKCVQPLKDKMLVSCQDATGGWYLSIITTQGEVCQQLKPTGLLDCHRIAVQTLKSGKDDFRIIICCEITKRLQCLEFDGSLVFDFFIDKVTSVVTDANGYIFAIRYTGEIQVFSPNGEFLLKFHRQSLYKAKFSVFNQSMNKLFITMYKDSKIHVFNVKRTLSQQLKA